MKKLKFITRLAAALIALAVVTSCKVDPIPAATDINVRKVYEIYHGEYKNMIISGELYHVYVNVDDMILTTFSGNDWEACTNLHIVEFVDENIYGEDGEVETFNFTVTVISNKSVIDEPEVCECCGSTDCEFAPEPEEDEYETYIVRDCINDPNLSSSDYNTSGVPVATYGNITVVYGDDSTSTDYKDYSGTSAEALDCLTKWTYRGYDNF